MKVTLIDHLGDDLTVANAARVSFNKESQWNSVWTPLSEQDEMSYFVKGTFRKVLKGSDKGLISYLAKHKHWTPFSHPQITLRIKAPIFVARQLFKHKVGFTENEISRRYVSDEPEFYRPEVWRKKAEDKKQGSSEEAIHLHDKNVYLEAYGYEQPLKLYKLLLDDGVCPEQARMVLPQSMYTEWFWTGSLAAYARMCKQRMDSHAQAETREIARMISDIIEPLFPVSWSVLTRKDNNHGN